MKISVIICTRNRSKKLHRAINSVLAQGDVALSELVVIDQSDIPTAIEAPGDGGPILKYIWSKSIGLSHARNEALSIASGEIIAFTDDDCVVAPGWITGIHDTFAAYPEIDVVFGRVLAYSEDPVLEEVEHHLEEFFYGSTTYASKRGDLYCSALFDVPEPSVYDRPCLPYANLGSGNNMAYRRSIFNSFGSFICELGAGTTLGAAEDTEFQYRLLAHGRKLAYRPHIFVYHDNWLNVEQNARLQIRYLSGVTALFVWYGLRGDPLATELLRYIFGESEREIAEYEAEKGLPEYLWYSAKRRFAFLKGVVGGFYLALAYARCPELPSCGRR